MHAPEDDQVRGSLQAALVPILVMGLTALAVKFGLDSKDLQTSIYAVAFALAALIAAAYGWAMHFFKDQKVKRAEAIVPGITTVPRGSETSATVRVNDPKTPDPPITIQADNPKTP